MSIKDKARDAMHKAADKVEDAAERSEVKDEGRDEQRSKDQEQVDRETAEAQQEWVHTQGRPPETTRPGLLMEEPDEE